MPSNTNQVRRMIHAKQHLLVLFLLIFVLFLLLLFLFFCFAFFGLSICCCPHATVTAASVSPKLVLDLSKLVLILLLLPLPPRMAIPPTEAFRLTVLAMLLVFIWTTLSYTLFRPCSILLLCHVYL